MIKLKVIDLNLWQGRLLNEAIDFLLRENPDIIILQEVFDGHSNEIEGLNSLDVLKSKLANWPYHAFDPAVLFVDGDLEVVQGQAVFSKFFIKNSSAIFYDVTYGRVEFDRLELKGQVHRHTNDASMMPRNLQHVVIQASGVELNIYNTQGVWGRDGRDTERRMNMGKVIAENVLGKSNVILAGDFNLDPDTQAMAQVEKHLISVFGTSLKTTFNMKRKSNPGYAVAAVDMFFVSPTMKILSKDCLDEDVSDHKPLRVELGV